MPSFSKTNMAKLMRQFREQIQNTIQKNKSFQLVVFEISLTLATSNFGINLDAGDPPQVPKLLFKCIYTHHNTNHL